MSCESSGEHKFLACRWSHLENVHASATRRNPSVPGEIQYFCSGKPIARPHPSPQAPSPRPIRARALVMSKSARQSAGQQRPPRVPTAYVLSLLANSPSPLHQHCFRRLPSYCIVERSNPTNILPSKSSFQPLGPALLIARRNDMDKAQPSPSISADILNTPVICLARRPKPQTSPS